jgi:hypothetical protein
MGWRDVPALCALVVIGIQAKTRAETFAPGEGILLEGNRSDRAGKTKASGHLMGTCSTVTRRTAAAVAVSMDEEVSMIEVAVRDRLCMVTLPKAVLVLTKAQFIHALRRGQGWWCCQALHARLAPQERT